MLNASRLIFRSAAAGLKCGTPFRLQYSKQMLEEPGMGCCNAGIKLKEASGPNLRPKIKGPLRKLRLECIDNPCCADPFTSYDEDFKHLLKHKTRTKFQRTWRECPPRRMVQKITCGEPEPEPICIVQRERKCSSPVEECYKGNARCPKIRMPGCRPIVINKVCRDFKPANCEKIRCPYPAFSECNRSLLRPLPPVECDCLSMRGMCEVFSLMASKPRVKWRC